MLSIIFIGLVIASLFYWNVVGNELSADFPIVIVAGTQKSGTTVLAAYLSQHPNISMSETKELHHFDKNRVYKQGMDKYFSKFTPNEHSVYIGEATPSYIASRQACQRISQDLPQAKLVISLRDPVSRAYSEYQMKRRRVLEHADFVSLVSQHSRKVYACLLDYAGTSEQFKSCVPDAVRTHGRFGKLRKAFRKAFEKLQDWDAVLDLCFSSDNENTAFYDEYTDLEVDAEGGISVSESVHFHAAQCWRYYVEGLESVGDVHAALVQEIEDFATCAKLSDILMPDKKIEDRLEALDVAVDRCLQIKSGISIHFFYRSLYAVQLYHCQKYIPRENMLVIGTAELRNHPNATMGRILDFLSLPHYNFTWMPTDTQSLENVVQSRYGYFEKTTAWRLNSEYDSIPSELQSYMEGFYEPMNALLFDLLAINSTYASTSFW